MVTTATVHVKQHPNLLGVHRSVTPDNATEIEKLIMEHVRKGNLRCKVAGDPCVEEVLNWANAHRRESYFSEVFEWVRNKPWAVRPFSKKYVKANNGFDE